MIVAREKAEYYGLPEQPEKKRQSGRRSAASLKIARKDRLLYTGLVFIMFCSCAVIVGYYAQVLTTGYKISEAERELSLLRTESHGLYADINELSSLAYVETVAVNKLGMVSPPGEQVVVVQSVGQAKAPTEAPAVATNSPGNIAESTAAKKESNWMIKAFSRMLGRMEQSIQAG